jgi:hypothetical protein
VSKPIKLTKEQEDAIAENVKILMKEKFPFSTREQCISRKKAHFMSKEDIVTEIDKNDSLKRHFPANVDYKKLKKEEICEYLFKI